MNPITTIIAPIIHYNGTAQVDLEAERLALYEAISDCMDALKKTAPNGRDYYLVEGLLEKATAQFSRRERILLDLRDEIETELDAIQA